MRREAQRRSAARPTAGALPRLTPIAGPLTINKLRPVQLVAQRGVVVLAARVQEAHAVRRAAHADAVAVRRLGSATGMSKCTLASRRGDDRDRRPAPSSLQHDRPVRQRRAARSAPAPSRRRRVQDRPAGRQRVRGRAGRRADDQAVGAQVRRRTRRRLDTRARPCRPVAPRLTTDVVEREALEERLPSRTTSPSSMRALLVLVLAGEHRRRARSRMSPSGDVGDEAEPALVDADQRRAVARELARDAEHRAVAADHDRRGRMRAELRRGRGGVAAMRRGGAPVSMQHARSRARRESRESCSGARCRAVVSPISQRCADALALDHGRPASACRKRVAHSRDYTTATPCVRRKSLHSRRHARRARQDPAEDAGRALHRRRPAGRLAHAVAALGPRAFAGDASAT